MESQLWHASLTAWLLAIGRRSCKRYAELCVSSASRFISPKRTLLPNLRSLTRWRARALTGPADLTCSSALRLAFYTSALAFKHQRSLHVVPLYVCTICNNMHIPQRPAVRDKHDSYIPRTYNLETPQLSDHDVVYLLCKSM